MLTGELAIGRTLLGDLPSRTIPMPWAGSAPRWRLALTAKPSYARHWAKTENPINCAGSLARITMQAAHARLAHPRYLGA